MDMEQHKAKLGRWRRLVFAVIQKPIFWNLVPVMKLALGPLQHLVAFAHKRQVDGNFGAGSPFCSLVTGKVAKLMSKYESAFTDAALWAPEFVEAIPITKLDDGIALAVEVCLHAVAAFHPRFALELDKRRA